MKRKVMPVVGLLLRSGPYRQRSARSQLDVALVAAALDVSLRLYFLADAALQLADERDTRPAGLPVGYRGWASIASMAQVTVFAERSWLGRMAELGIEPLLKVQARTRAQMRADWEKCAKLLVL
jgi:hypothetical protein